MPGAYFALVSGEKWMYNINDNDFCKRLCKANVKEAYS